MGKPHKHAEFIKAWADGADIQYFSQIMNQWVDLPLGSVPTACTTSYRIKPLVVRFRNYLCQVAVGMAWVNAHQERSPLTAEELEKQSYFKGWIGDWQEIEVE